MRLIVVLCFSLAAASVRGATRPPIKVGDHVSEVIEVLGKPQGRVSRGDAEILWYRRGTVTIVNKEVTAFKLVSAAEAWRQLIERRRREQAQREAAQAAREKGIADGLAEKEKTLEDPAFAEKSPEQQLLYWRGFRKKYPEVSVADRIASLERDIGSDAARQELQKKIVMLKLEMEAAEETAGKRNVWTRTRKFARAKAARLREEVAQLEAQLASL